MSDKSSHWYNINEVLYDINWKMIMMYDHVLSIFSKVSKRSTLSV